MYDFLLDPPLVRMPELAGGEWLNTDEPLTRERLRGRVVLIDFWDYTCVNCIHTLPYLRAWHRRYADKGLVIIGVHAPEFKFARNTTLIAQAVNDFELPYPVLVDRHFQVWTQFANKAWPTKHLIDAQGYIRFRRQGEGYYVQTEQAIQTLLLRRDPQVTLPEILPPLRREDAPGAICYRPTPELYAGFRGGGLFGSGLGNPEGYVTDGIMMYKMPQQAQQEEGQFYVEGFWRAWPESLAHAGKNGGRIVLPYSAAGVNAVLSPSADAVEVMLNLRPSQQEPLIEVRQDGRSLSRAIAGQDIVFDDDGRSFLLVERPRMYEIVRNRTFAPHYLSLTFRAKGLALYTFSFTTCIAGERAPEEEVFKRR